MDLPSERPWFLPLSPATEMSEILRRFAAMHCPSRGTKLANWEGYTKNHVAVLKWWELFDSPECNPWPRKKMRISQLHFIRDLDTSVNEHGWKMEIEDGDISDILSDSYLQMLVFQPCLPHDKPAPDQVVTSNWAMCPGAEGGFFRSVLKHGSYLEPENQENSTPMEPPITWILKKTCVTSQITLKLEGISVEDMTDGDSMLMK